MELITHIFLVYITLHTYHSTSTGIFDFPLVFVELRLRNLFFLFVLAQAQDYNNTFYTSLLYFNYQKRYYLKIIHDTILT